MCPFYKKGVADLPRMIGAQWCYQLVNQSHSELIMVASKMAIWQGTSHINLSMWELMILSPELSLSLPLL
jgi:hypothetical protein